MYIVKTNKYIFNLMNIKHVYRVNVKYTVECCSNI